MAVGRGRTTGGVVRVGDTVRRPRNPNSAFVRLLLAHLHEHDFDAAPESIGEDDEGREIFSFLDGDVPPDLDSGHSDDTLAAAAQLIRRYHDATAGSILAGTKEVVCHGDLSPCNTVFRDGQPLALIDFDTAAPGTRLQDLGYALFLWLNLGTDGPSPREQARRVGVFCKSYGIGADVELIDATLAAVAANVDRLHADGRPADAAWWLAQLAWLERHREELTL
jgi:aminoglycoside phosphotransferase (APT) family kinase protein